MLLKKIIFWLIFIIHIFTNVYADQTKETQNIYVYPTIGWYQFHNDQLLEGGPFFGLNGGYRFTKHIALEAGAMFGWFKNECDKKDCMSDNVNGSSIYLSGLYHLLPDNSLSPYVHAGFSNIQLDETAVKDCYDSIRYGVGIDYAINNNIAFRTSLSHLITTDNSHNNFAVDFGIRYFFVNASKTSKLYEKKNSFTNEFHSNGDENIYNRNKPEQLNSELSENVIKNVNPIKTMEKDTEPNEEKSDEKISTLKNKIEKDEAPKNIQKKEFAKTANTTNEHEETVINTEEIVINTEETVIIDEQDLDIDFDEVNDSYDQCLESPPGEKVDLLGCSISNYSQTFKESNYDRCVSKTDSVLSNNSGCHIITPVYFMSGKTQINEYTMMQLQKLLSILRYYQQINVGIFGHTDNEGSFEYNKKLSLMRSNVVKKYLIEQGISEKRLKSKAYGYTKPVVPNASNKYKSKNRRVEIVLLKD